MDDAMQDTRTAATPTRDEIDALCRQWRPLSVWCANRFLQAKGLGPWHVLVDEVYSAANLGLWRAAMDFRPERKGRFSTFATRRIYSEFGILMRTLGRGKRGGNWMRVQSNSRAVRRHEPSYWPTDPEEPPTVDWDRLDDRERFIIGARLQGQTLVDLAKVLDVTVQRVEYISQRAVRKLRA